MKNHRQREMENKLRMYFRRNRGQLLTKAGKKDLYEYIFRLLCKGLTKNSLFKVIKEECCESCRETRAIYDEIGMDAHETQKNECFQ